MLGWTTAWLGCHWWLPIQILAIGLMQPNFVDQDQRRITAPAVAEAGTQFTDPDGMER
jgi:hypothetical protein